MYLYKYIFLEREREDIKLKKNERDIKVNDPQELMVYIQKEFRS